MHPLCLINHKWTSAAEEGIEPTKEHLQKGLDGFLDYAAIYCKRCGTKHRLNRAPIQQKFKETSMSEQEHISSLLKNEFHKMSFFFENVSSVNYFRIASFPQRQRPERSERLYLKNTRSFLGLVKTTWR